VSFRASALDLFAARDNDGDVRFAGHFDGGAMRENAAPAQNDSRRTDLDSSAAEKCSRGELDRAPKSIPDGHGRNLIDGALDIRSVISG
jgi:hypothetical protein